MPDDLLITWEEIAGELRRPVSTVRRWGPELFREKITFYQMVGKPPRRVVCAFREDLRAWYKRKIDSIGPY